MVKPRAGAGRLGCLVGLLLLVTVVYFGFNIGEVYFRYYRLKDAMEQEVRFAETHSDSSIKAHMRAVADSLGLPEAAGRVSIERTNSRVVISSDYSEHVELPMFVREFHFKPRAVR